MRRTGAWFLFFASISTLIAQTDRGTITGTVTDPKGAVVPGAAVEAANLATGTTQATITTSTGNYVIPQLPSGEYQLTVSAKGFKQFLRTPLTVETAQTMRIDVPLELGSAADSVTVKADATLLRTESGAVSHNVTVASLDDLPILGIGASAAGSFGIRNPYAVVQLVPGAYFAPNSNMVVNGALSNTAAYRVEGQDGGNQLVYFATQDTQPGADAIQEVSIQTGNYSAEFGAAGGGLFNVTMRSGTRRYHGSGYDYFVNEALNAATPFVNLKPVARRNDYGFTLGGPLSIPRIYDGHGKTFFFWSWEQYRESNVINNVAQTVPTPAYRGGDFGPAILGAGGGAPRVLTPSTDVLGRPLIADSIYDPGTERPVTVGGQIYIVRDVFAQNKIDPAKFDPVAVKIQNLIPAPAGPNASGIANNFLSAYPNDRISDIPSLKLDQNLGRGSRLAFYWSRTGTESQYSPTGQADGLPLPITAARGNFIHSHIERINFDHALTSTLLLHLGAGYQQTRRADDSPVLNFNPLSQIGLKGATLNRNFPVISGLNSGSATGGMAAMGPTAGQSPASEIKPTANLSATWARKNHIYKTGAEFRIEGFSLAQYSNTAGNFAFGTTQTGLPALQGVTFQNGNVGFAYASFLLGLVNSASIAAPAETRDGKQQWALFVTDTWKITRKWTLDYGLRLDYGTYSREQYGRNANFAPELANPSAGGRPGAVIFEGSGPGHCGCSFAENYPYAFGPRLGTAYQITPKTVLRAGWGLAYNGTMRFGGTITNSQMLMSPQFGAPAMTLAGGIPITPVWPVINPGIYPVPGTNNPSPFFLDPNAGRPARQNQWSVGIQREIHRNLAAEVSYVANRGAWWPISNLASLNSITAVDLAAHGLSLSNAQDRTLLTTSLQNLSSQQRARGFGGLPYSGFPTAATVLQSLRPFPQFSGLINPTGAPLGNTWYDSLQSTVTQRLTRGLSLSGTFTWSKSLALLSGNNDIFNRGLNKTLSPFDQPFVFQLSGEYRLPGWKIARGWSWLLEDWTVAAYIQRSSGIPLNVPPPSTNPGMGNLIGRGTTPNRDAGQPLYSVPDLNCHCFDPNKTFVLNPTAWSNPAPGEWGAAAAFYADYRAFRRPIDNLSLGRTIRIREKYALMIRAEFTNALNRTYLNNPQLNVTFTSPQTRNAQGQTTGGFGWIDTRTVSLPARQGTLVARFQF